MKKKGRVMNASKKLGRCICGSMMIFVVSFSAAQGSLAANPTADKKITKQFLTSGQVDLIREVVTLPLHRGRLSSGGARQRPQRRGALTRHPRALHGDQRRILS